MKKRIFGVFAAVTMVGVLATGCGQKAATPAPASDAPSASTVALMKGAETTVAPQFKFTVTDVKGDAGGVLEIDIDGPADGQDFQRTGVAIGAAGKIGFDKGIKDVKTIAVQYTVNKNPDLAATVPYQSVVDYVNHKISAQDFAKEFKIGQASAKK